MASAWGIFAQFKSLGPHQGRCSTYRLNSNDNPEGSNVARPVLNHVCATRYHKLGCRDLIEPELFEIVLVEAEVVRGLVQHRDAHLGGELVEIGGNALE